MKKLHWYDKQRLLRIQELREDKRAKRPKPNSNIWIPNLGLDYQRTLQYLGENRFCDRVRIITKHKYKITIPKTFSLIENPDETLEILDLTLEAARDRKIRELYLNHSACQELDLAASAVMDIIIMSGTKSWRHRKRPHLHGRYSTNSEVNEILRVTGIIKHIKHPDSDVSDDIRKKYKIFELYRGKKREAEAFQSSDAERVTTDLTGFFNDLLSTKGYSLTPSGQNHIANLISEVLDNAEQHSGTTEWYVMGYMSQETRELGRCYIVIFDFGESIYKSLSAANLNIKLKSHIDALIDRHTKKGFFEFKDKWSHENLWTLFALQEGISRYNIGNVQTDRGHGTVNMIEFFLKLGQSVNNKHVSKMALLSGNTYILFDGKYSLQNVDIDNEKRQVIAFNKVNSLEEKPDENYVRQLKHRFPGTLISMSFVLDKKYLDKIKSEGQ